MVPFKKGPDYIDPAWLKLAAGNHARNLDTWMMGAENVVSSFHRFCTNDGINIIEANRGLHDGEDSRGTHSSAELAKLLKCPVALVLPVVKVTRTAAAILLGIKLFDKNVNLCGVILNNVATKRQESVIRGAIENETGIPALGAVYRNKTDLLPGRHLGLITPEENQQAVKAIEEAGKLIRDSVDLSKISAACHSAPGLKKDLGDNTKLTSDTVIKRRLKIGYFTGSAFTFYYPENLESLESDSVELIPVNPFELRELPDIDALYIGGGFPETHGAKLSDNKGFLDSVRRHAENGLPIYAECGGLMFLCRRIIWNDKQFPMAGVFEHDVSISRKPAGHGYVEVEVDRANPFYETGTRIRGHEFHYSNLVNFDETISTAFSVKRGRGLGLQRDGLIKRNVLAAYLHVHAIGTDVWRNGIIYATENFNRTKLKRKDQ